MSKKTTSVIFSLDPGSVRCGWAVLDMAEQLLGGGVLTPDKRAVQPQFRIRALCCYLRKLLNEIVPLVIVIEITSGKVGRKRHKGGGAGLAVYGMAIGRIWGEAQAWVALAPRSPPEARVVLVKENEWTRGVPKGDRIEAVAAAFPAYKIADDPGGDLADAIGLGCWWIREQKVRLVEQVKGGK